MLSEREGLLWKWTPERFNAARSYMRLVLSRGLQLPSRPPLPRTLSHADLQLLSLLPFLSSTTLCSYFCDDHKSHQLFTAMSTLLGADDARIDSGLHESEKALEDARSHISNVQAATIIPSGADVERNRSLGNLFAG